MTTNTNTHEATYCPEDNKLRLYVGRVEREEYMKLRKDGWKSTPKQDCDFVASWTPSREDTAIEYAGEIGDEDQSPADRAADRAERFAGYRDKRTSEAEGFADRYEAGGSVIGHQNAYRAEKQAKRIDRLGTHASTQWSKASYWTSRTEGVISHALYVSEPSVRLGRIREIEKTLRIENICPRWKAHSELRLGYENQMIEAAGGAAGELEIKVGDLIEGHAVIKINKSNATGKVTSVDVVLMSRSSKRYGTYWSSGSLTEKIAGDVASIKLTRALSDCHAPATEESLQAVKDYKERVKAAKASKPKAPSLINPTNEDAERLQKIWNAKARERCHFEVDDSEVLFLTMDEYKKNSVGAYAIFSTALLAKGGNKVRCRYGSPLEQGVFKVRNTGWSTKTYDAYRVIVITDKPQKPFPATAWEEQDVLEKQTA